MASDHLYNCQNLMLLLPEAAAIFVEFNIMDVDSRPGQVKDSKPKLAVHLPPFSRVPLNKRMAINER